MKHSPEKITLIAEAIFSKETLRVVEGYSDFDREPIEFFLFWRTCSLLDE